MIFTKLMLSQLTQRISSNLLILGFPNDEQFIKKHEKSSLKSCCFLTSNFEGFGVENDFILGAIWGVNE